jgi:hypothetical protein
MGPLVIVCNVLGTPVSVFVSAHYSCEVLCMNDANTVGHIARECCESACDDSSL